MIGTRLGPYEIVAAIGKGGMGEVYRARDTRLGRTVAVKVLSEALAKDPRVRERFTREARVVSQLTHPHICTLFDVGETPGDRGFLVMEYLDGEPLDRCLAGRRVSVDEIIELAIQIADALDAAHAYGVVHRDLKPANLFVTARGQLKVLDFGVARFDAGGADAEPGDPRTTLLTTEGWTVGTVAYMSPEQARGEAVDARSDIFSFGLVLYEMATGRRAFSGSTAAVIFDGILNRSPKPILDANPAVPPALARLIDRSLEKDRGERYQNARDMLTELREIKRSHDSSVMHAAVAPAIRHAAMVTPSIAVLPFADLSPQADQDHFCEGMAADLIAALASLPGLRVASRTSSFQFKGQSKDIREIGARLKADTVLEGTVQKAGRRLRVTVQLVSTSAGYQLWSARYDRDMDDVFAVQDDIAHAIVGQLKVTLGRDADHPLVKRTTDDLEAYNLYLKGRYFWSRRGGFVGKAVECFEQAIARDPSYALAHAGLADAYGVLGVYGILPAREAAAKARPAAERAVELDATLAEAHRALAVIRVSFDWDLPAAERSYRRALELGPTSGEVHAIYAYCLSYMHRVDDALAATAQARALEPESILVAGYSAMNLMFARRYNEALDECRRCLSLDPGFATAYWVRTQILTVLRQHELAIEAATRAVALTDRQGFYLSGLGVANGAAGRRAEAEQILEELHERADREYVSPLWFADIHTHLGNAERALEWLERAYDDRTQALVSLGISPLFDGLRGNPRFQALLKRIGLPDDSTA